MSGFRLGERVRLLPIAAVMYRSSYARGVVVKAWYEKGEPMYEVQLDGTNHGQRFKETELAGSQ